MIPTLQWDETSGSDQRCQMPTLLKRDHGIAMGMEHEGRYTHCLGEGCDVQLIQGLMDRHRIFRRRRNAHQLVERAMLLRRAVGHEQRCENLSKGRIVTPPADAR